MPYQTTESTSGSKVSSGTNLTDLSSWSIDATTSYDCVYSWRTGSGVDVNKMLPEPGSEGNLAERLLARKRVIERQLDELQLGATGSNSHFLTKDYGHDFGVYHSKTYSGQGSVSHRPWRGGDLRKWVNPVPSTSPRLFHNGGVIYDAIGYEIPDYGRFFLDRGATLPTDTTHVTNPSTLVPYGLDQRGESTRLINVANPFENQASFAVTALELLRGDVPRVLGNLRKHYIEIQALKTRFRDIRQATKYLGEQSLNVQFGWAPIIRDVADGLKVLLSVDRALFPSDSTRRRRDAMLYSAGHTTRRGVEWATTPHLSQRYGGFPSQQTSLLFNSRSATGENRRVLLDTDIAIQGAADIRLTAKFRTGLSPTAISNGYVDRGLDLLGLKITPEVLWDLTPWTWLIDWFSNIGTIVSNVSTLGADNARLNYAYSTLRYRETVSFNSFRPPLTNDDSSKPEGYMSWDGDITFVQKNDMKVRLAASPFGFSVSTPDLSIGQWGILSSLGLARAR